MENSSTITCLQTLFPSPQRGRCICFRTTGSDPLEVWSVRKRFYSVPFDFFVDGVDPDNEINSSKNRDVEFLLPFYELDDDVWTRSSVASIGSSLFVVGGDTKLFVSDPTKLKNIIHRFDTTAPAGGWHTIPMLTHRSDPQTVVMDGKLYVFGDGHCAADPEMFDPCSSTCVQLPPTPGRATDRFYPVTAALQPSKRIIVASPDVPSVFNIVDHVWEEWDDNEDFSCVQGQAAGVLNSTILCWFSRNGEKVLAYDLVLRRWFVSPIEGLDKVLTQEPHPDNPLLYCPLVPLGGNHLCGIWEELGAYNGTILPLVHCAKIGVSKYRDARGKLRFDAAVIVSRSYVLLQSNEVIQDAFVFLGEENEGGERGSGLGVHDYRGSCGPCGYGGGDRIPKSIVPFKICSKCSFVGHMERDCTEPCRMCGEMGHSTRACGEYVNRSGSSVGQSSKHCKVGHFPPECGTILRR